MTPIQFLTFSTSLLVSLLVGGTAHAANDDPLLSKLMLNEVQTGVGSNKPSSFDAQAWIGKDINKLWLKAKGEYFNSDQQTLAVQALYSRAVSAYWDVQLGAKVDIEPSPSRQWAVLGFQGLAPYHFDIDAALLIGEQERTALHLSAEHDMLITQKLILAPAVQTTLYGRNDPEVGIGAGLSSMGAGVRLRYEIVREFAPYIGVNWERSFRNTAAYAQAQGEKKQHTYVAVGFRA